MDDENYIHWKALRDSEQYLRYDQLKDCCAYLISARRSRIGIWRAAAKCFVIVREKMGNIFLFEEYHWDEEGTAKPYVLVGGPYPQTGGIDERLPPNWRPILDALTIEYPPERYRALTAKFAAPLSMEGEGVE